MPNLRVNINADWIWVGFIRAGHTTPTRQAHPQGGKVDDEEREQLPAYAPPKECWRRLVEGAEETGRDEQDEWLVEPPSIEPYLGRGNERWVEPPEYR